MKGLPQYFIELKPNYSCNQACPFCWFADRSRSKMEASDVVANLAFLLARLQTPRELSAVHLRISGGEFTIRSDHLELLDVISCMGFASTVLHTNAVTCADPAAARALGARVRQMYVAYHSYDQASHEFASGGRTRWRDVVAGIANLKRTGCTVMTNTLIMRHNVERLPLLASQLADLKVDVCAFNFPVPKAGCAVHADELIVESIEQARKPLREARVILESAGVEFVLTDWAGFPACWRERLVPGHGDERVYEELLPRVILVDAEHQYTQATNLFAMQFEDDIVSTSEMADCRHCTKRPVCKGVHRLLRGRAGFDVTPISQPRAGG